MWTNLLVSLYVDEINPKNGYTPERLNRTTRPVGASVDPTVVCLETSSGLTLPHTHWRSSIPVLWASQTMFGSYRPVESLLNRDIGLKMRLPRRLLRRCLSPTKNWDKFRSLKLKPKCDDPWKNLGPSDRTFVLLENEWLHGRRGETGVKTVKDYTP